MIWSVAGGGPVNWLQFNSDNTIRWFADPPSGGGAGWNQVTTGVYRDPSAWMHVFVAVDTTLANQTDRAKLYINGELATLSTAGYPSQNGTLRAGSGYQGVGYSAGYDNKYLDGYLSEVHCVTGTAYAPTDFGEFNDDGVWRPIEVSGLTYGTNGFYLTFDPSATNGIGHDHSGNGNNFTPSGFTTSGPGLSDVFSDTPTTNWATLNPLETFNGRFSNAPTNGNLEISIPTDGTLKRNYPGKYASIVVPTTGKYYFEFETDQQYTRVVAVDVDYSTSVDSGDELSLTDRKSVQFSVFDGNYYYNGANNSTASGHGSNSSPSGDIYGVAIDLGNGTFRVNKNGVSGTELDISTWAGESARVSAYISGSTASGTIKYNFGANEFAYPPGTTSGTDYFKTVTWTGNGSATSRVISGVGFAPDLVWIKGRSVNSGQRIQDRVRGAGLMIQANSSAAEFDDTANVGSFTSDGFTLTTTGSSYNQSGQTYVAWCWKAGGGTTSSNTNGSTTSQVSVNNDAGFSIVKYVGTGSLATVGHGLDAAPDCILTKPRDGGDHNWGVYHRYGSQGAQTQLQLQTTTAPNTGTSFWNGTHPTSSVFTVNTASGTNNSGSNIIAYCFTSKAGVSKFGSYSGTGATQFIECGFKPAFVLMKSSAAAREWIMKDTARGPDKTLEAHETNSEAQSETVGFQLNENGFTLVGNSVVNVNGDSLIFMAFAENFVGDTDAKFLNSANLPTPSIKDGSDYFNPLIYLPDGSSSFSVTGVGFQPDLVWVKSRNYNEDHQLNDAVRGATKALQSNLTNGETTQSNGLTSFDSDGFTVGNLSDYNFNGDSIISWNWLAGGSGSSNTDGSITSTVSANPAAGFSIVSYTGTGSNATVGHGLGVAPKMLIIANRDLNGYSWRVYHESAGNTKYLDLSSDSSVGTTTIWQSTSPSSTVWSMEGNASINRQDDRHICYAFADIEGYSKFGGYNGGDGVFVYLGFKPAFLLTKGTLGTRNWNIHDSKRNTYNVVDILVHPNRELAESAQGSSSFDFVSNGFVQRGGNISGTGDLVVYAAFAENPFGGRTASPATAR